MQPGRRDLVHCPQNPPPCLQESSPRVSRPVLDRYPIFYLLHGAFDSANSCCTVGRARFILDNLIAAGKAKPMVLVMPHGHTGSFRSGGALAGEFEPELIQDILPQMEQRYRIHTDRANRAIPGLSMGGAHTRDKWREYLNEFAPQLFR